MRVKDGVISPGGIGFDINCGMRLIHTNLTLPDVQPHLEDLVNSLFRSVPVGVGTHGMLSTAFHKYGNVFFDVMRQEEKNNKN